MAERLYNNGYISYPRTETDQFEDNFKHKEYLESQIRDKDWGHYASNLLNQGYQNPRKGKNNDKAHPPIHPLKCGSDLSGAERSIFEYICRRYLASLSRDAQLSETFVQMKIAGEKFYSKGTQIIEKQYLDVFIYDKVSEKSIPSVSEGRSLKVSNLSQRIGNTSSPALLSETELISIMDKNGIGTDATIHEHIQKVLDRGYAVKVNNRFSPTSLGLGLVIGYDAITNDASLTKPTLRASLEKDLEQIISRTKTCEKVIEERVNQFERIYQTIEIEFQNIYGSVKFYKESNIGTLNTTSEKINERKKIKKPNISSQERNRRPISRKRPHIENHYNNQNSMHVELKCQCGLIAPVFISKKSGSNGRKFATCGKKVHKCKYFEWIDK